MARDDGRAFTARTGTSDVPDVALRGSGFATAFSRDDGLALHGRHFGTAAPDMSHRSSSGVDTSLGRDDGRSLAARHAGTSAPSMSLLSSAGVDTAFARDDGAAVRDRAFTTQGVQGHTSARAVDTSLVHDDGRAIQERAPTGGLDLDTGGERSTVHMYRNHARGLAGDMHTLHRELTDRDRPLPDGSIQARPTESVAPSAARQEFDAMLAASTYTSSAVASHGVRAAMIRRAKHSKDSSVLGGPAPITDDAADAPGV